MAYNYNIDYSLIVNGFNVFVVHRLIARVVVDVAGSGNFCE